MNQLAIPGTNTIERMREKLSSLEPSEIAIEDESAMHAGHEGAKSGGGHYRLRVISEHFAGLAPLARHRLVYDALADMMQRDIHALSIQALTPDEAFA